MSFKKIDISQMKTFLIGNAEDAEAATGCTVVIAEQGAVAGVDVRGGGPATRETDLLRSENTVDKIHAVVLSGGSAFGLEAGSGVMRGLEERGIGFPMGHLHVPIVCQASLYDLEIGRSDVRPDVEMGREACENAYKGVFQNGNHGAGTGASVGKFYGMDRAMKTGLGTFACSDGKLEVGAIAAVNAFGDVYDGRNSIIAGLLSQDKNWIKGTISTLKNHITTEDIGRPQQPDIINPFRGETRILRSLFEKKLSEEENAPVTEEEMQPLAEEEPSVPTEETSVSSEEVATSAEEAVRSVEEAAAPVAQEAPQDEPEEDDAAEYFFDEKDWKDLGIDEENLVGHDEQDRILDDIMAINEEELQFYEEHSPAEEPAEADAMSRLDATVQTAPVTYEDEPMPEPPEETGHSLNTTISVLLTNARLTKAQANKLASILHDGYARAIKPVHSSLDGDTIFVMCTGEVDVHFDAFAALATDMMQYAVIDAALSAEDAYGLPSASSFRTKSRQ